MEIIPTQKIVNRDGIKAVKNGQKANQYSSIPNQKKPEWIRVKATFDKILKRSKSKSKTNASTQSAKRPCAQTSLSVGVLVLLHLCSWARSAPGPASFARSTQATQKAG